MNLNAIPVGKDAPNDINVIIEISMNSDPVKYEFDKEIGALKVDRIGKTPMFYPCNYGFVPHTLSDDGDPVDVMLISRYPLLPGVIINARPIGVLIMEDESGMDEKIIAVPTSKVYPYYDGVNELSDLPPLVLQEITHFFEHYKDLDKNKWVKISDTQDTAAAKEIILKAIANYKP